jgi:hypothetical protein
MFAGAFFSVLFFQFGKIETLFILFKFKIT